MQRRVRSTTRTLTTTLGALTTGLLVLLCCTVFRQHKQPATDLYIAAWLLPVGGIYLGLTRELALHLATRANGPAPERAIRIWGYTALAAILACIWLFEQSLGSIFVLRPIQTALDIAVTAPLLKDPRKAGAILDQAMSSLRTRWLKYCTALAGKIDAQPLKMLLLVPRLAALVLGWDIALPWLLGVHTDRTTSQSHVPFGIDTIPYWIAFEISVAIGLLVGRLLHGGPYQQKNTKPERWRTNAMITATTISIGISTTAPMWWHLIA
jgi:hypothetical protein